LNAPFDEAFKEEASPFAMVSAVPAFSHLDEAAMPPTVASTDPASYFVVVVELTPPLSEPLPGATVKSPLSVAL
jgi:hypothetical protein